MPRSRTQEDQSQSSSNLPTSRSRRRSSHKEDQPEQEDQGETSPSRNSRIPMPMPSQQLLPSQLSLQESHHLHLRKQLPISQLNSRENQRAKPLLPSKRDQLEGSRSQRRTPPRPRPLQRQVAPRRRLHQRPELLPIPLPLPLLEAPIDPPFISFSIGSLAFRIFSHFQTISSISLISLLVPGTNSFLIICALYFFNKIIIYKKFLKDY